MTADDDVPANLRTASTRAGSGRGMVAIFALSALALPVVNAIRRGRL